MQRKVYVQKLNARDTSEDSIREEFEVLGKA